MAVPSMDVDVVTIGNDLSQLRIKEEVRLRCYCTYQQMEVFIVEYALTMVLNCASQEMGFIPTEKQVNAFRNFCAELKLDWEAELDLLKTGEAFEARYTALEGQAKAAPGTKVPTTAQTNYLAHLGVRRSDIAKLKTRKEASDRIKAALALRGPVSEAPTRKQLAFLEELAYKGSPPETKGRASQIITLLLHAKSVARFLARARAMRMTEAQIQKFEAFLASVPRQLQQ